MRPFSTSARQLLQKIWKGVPNIKFYHDLADCTVKTHPTLAKEAVQLVAHGNEQEADDDPMHVTFEVWSLWRRLTTMPVYRNGTVRFGKDKYNAVTKKPDNGVPTADPEDKADGGK